MSHPDRSRDMQSSRRTFLRATAAAVAAGAVGRPSVGRAAETLAVAGGRKAVTVPEKEHSDACRWPRFGDAEKKFVAEILDLSASTCYRELPLFEKEWKQYHQIPYCKSHMNGTSALTSMFFAMDFPPGTEIMVPTYTFFGTILPMRFFGYVPVFIDINPRTATMDVEHMKKQLTPRTKAVIPMHSWGLPCDMDAICDFAKEHGLMVCEDAAHAHPPALGRFGHLHVDNQAVEFLGVCRAHRLGADAVFRRRAPGALPSGRDLDPLVDAVIVGFDEVAAPPRVKFAHHRQRYCVQLAYHPHRPINYS